MSTCRQLPHCLQGLNLLLLGSALCPLLPQRPPGDCHAAAGGGCADDPKQTAHRWAAGCAPSLPNMMFLSAAISCRPGLAAAHSSRCRYNHPGLQMRSPFWSCPSCLPSTLFTMSCGRWLLGTTAWRRMTPHLPRELAFGQLCCACCGKPLGLLAPTVLHAAAPRQGMQRHAKACNDSRVADLSLPAAAALPLLTAVVQVPHAGGGPRWRARSCLCLKRRRQWVPPRPVWTLTKQP